MSGISKSGAYRAFLIICGLIAVIGTVIVACTAIDPARADQGFLWAFGFAVAVLILLPLNTLVHELGHLAFGFLSGMHFSSVRFGWLRLVRIGDKVKLQWLRHRDVAGSCEMYPRDDRNLERRMIVYSLGGAIFNLAYGVALLLTFLLPMHPVLYFFQLFAPLSLLEAASCLYPAETATGKTDGGMVRSLLRREPSAVVALHVLAAQGILSRGTYSDVSEQLLYDVPAVREDDGGFQALTQLRWQYNFWAGKEERALSELERLRSLYEYLPELNRGDVACDLIYADCVLSDAPERAEEYLADAAYAKGTCAYFRAMAAYECATGRDASAMLAEARSAAAEEPVRGIAALEEVFIGRIDG